MVHAVLAVIRGSSSLIKSLVSLYCRVVCLFETDVLLTIALSFFYFVLNIGLNLHDYLEGIHNHV